MSNRLWPPAAATSSARFAWGWPANVREVAGGDGCRRQERGGVDRGRRARRLAAEMGDRLHEGLDADDRRPVGEGRLGRVRGRHEKLAEPGTLRRRGDRKRAADRMHATVEAELAEDAGGREIGQRPPRFRGEDAERDREVVVGALLADPGGREVHGHAALRVLEPGVAERGADAVARLANGAVGEADRGSVRQARGDVDLDVDDERVDAAERAGADTGEHRLRVPGAARRDNRCGRNTRR